MRPVREADHSPTFSAEVKKASCDASTLPYIVMALSLIEAQRQL
jgi:hypothetical protein